MLGTIEAWDGGQRLPLGGPKQRALLALLVLANGTEVPAERLEDELWGGEPPAAAGVTLRAYLSRLRSQLGSTRLRKSSGGYRLDAPDDEVDARAFVRLIAAGKDALARGRSGEADGMLSEGLALWRGSPATEAAAAVALQGRIAPLEELHLQALELRLEARAQLGFHTNLIVEAEGLVLAHPLREQLWSQLMLALARGGRKAEALAAYERARAVLADDLGVIPGPGLREIHRSILRDEVEVRQGESLPVHNLPASTTSFVGRDREVAELESLLLHRRCVVLSGTGGVGKSRLAVDVARRVAGRFRDGVRLVEFAPLSSPNLVVGAVAAATGVSVAGGREQLAQQLVTSEMLLVLDNCEHLVGPVARLVTHLLASCEGIHVLATSRERLGVPGEAVQQVKPLPHQLHASGSTSPSAAPAIGLFLDRVPVHPYSPDAQQVQAIIDLCRELDGLPLAIELAAARTGTLPVTEIAAHMNDRFRLQGAGRSVLPARHRTLGATMDWSYSLLSTTARRTLRELAAFAGGFTLEAAVRVCFAGDKRRAAERLGELVDASLLSFVEQGGVTRYRVLETVRQYAAGKLARSGEAAAVRQRHAEFFLALAESANLSGEAEGAQDHAAVIGEQDNMRAAIEWATTTGRIELAMRLTVALENFWVTNDPFEGVRLLSQLLDAGPLAPTLQRARVLRALGSSLHVSVAPGAARETFEESLRLFRLVGDARGEAVLLYRLGPVYLDEGDWQTAQRLLLASLATFRKLSSRRGEVQAIGALGSVQLATGHPRRGRILMTRSAAMAEEIGRLWWCASMLLNLAELERTCGELSEAERRAHEALELGRRVGDRRIVVYALAHLSTIAAARGDISLAGRYWGIVERQELRPVGGWEAERGTYAARIVAADSAEFQAGRAETRDLALDDALPLVVPVFHRRPVGTVAGR